MKITYYRYENLPCRVSATPTGSFYAEAYFPGHGFAPYPVMDVLWHGELLSEKEFKHMVAGQSRANRNRKPY